MNAQAEVRSAVPTLIGGGHVAAIVPQTFEETFRISRAVVAAGLAPSALIGKKTGDDAASAVAVAIMSGAELGLKPMVALRSFTVINGKPALYGDGLINVVRMSGKVAHLRTGYARDDKKMLRDAGVLPSEESEKFEPGITDRVFASLTDDQRTFGYCVAKRLDTGEEKTVVFSVADAIRAGLWQTEALVRKQVWDGGSKVWKDNQPNDSPWYRFPQRMLAWRAAGYCLRELFGDVLGGIRDEFELREIEGVEEMRDITPQDRPQPPKPPVPPSAKQEVEDAEIVDNETGEIIDERETVTETGEDTGAVMDEGDQIDDADFLHKLEDDLAVAEDAATIEEIWTEADPMARFEGNDDFQSLSTKIKKRHLKRVGGDNG